MGDFQKSQHCTAVTGGVGEFVVTDLSRRPNPRQNACGCAVVWLFIECSRSVQTSALSFYDGAGGFNRVSSFYEELLD